MKDKETKEIKCMEYKFALENQSEFYQDMCKYDLLIHDDCTSCCLSIYDVALDIMMMISGAADYDADKIARYAEALKIRLKQWDKRTCSTENKEFSSCTRRIVEIALETFERNKK